MSDLTARLALLLVFALTACGEEPDEAQPRAGGDELPVRGPHEPATSTERPGWLDASGEVDGDALLRWLHARGHSRWSSTGWPRPTPEGDSVVFMNARLEASVAGGGRVHPVGSVAVREIYGLDLTTPRAINVLIKIAPGSGASSWRWIERDAPGSLSLDAVDAPQCVGCHADPEDVVLTSSLR